MKTLAQKTLSIRTLSLRGRLLLVASLTLFVFLGLMGGVLDQAFRKSAERGVAERLLLHIYGLLATTDEADGELFLPDALQEPGFNRLGTGLFALVLDERGAELWRSPSAIDLGLPPPSMVALYTRGAPGEPVFSQVANDTGEALFSLSYRVLWQGASGTTTPYVFVVLQTRDTYLSEVAGFRNNLWGWLAGVVIALILVQGLVMNWGLMPLRRLEADLKRIEDGASEYLEGDYPAEIGGVTRNLNLLLASERQQREKYRLTLGDLAHSLKTPLAILRGAFQAESDPSSLRATVDEQVARMNDIVAYQLERAVSSAPMLIRKPIDVAPVAERLVTAMNKVYAAKQVRIETRVDDCSFLGDERDLMELLGNLLDNACKFCQTRVQFQARAAPDAARLKFVVEDDGPGISAGERARVLRRGARLDSHTPGQGIGLAVVVEIVSRYGGEIELGASALGGTRVEVELP
ncbi:MAG: ATP-binding protein [Pseudomonadota bacterium]